MRACPCSVRHRDPREIRTDHEVVLLDHGHPAPMLLHGDGSADFPKPPAYALPLGLSAHGDDGPRPYRVGFAPGEQLLLFTDGVTEARDVSGRFCPLAERAHLLSARDAHLALDAPDALREDVVRHVDGPLHDDAAMLLLRYHGHGETKPVPIGERAGASAR